MSTFDHEKLQVYQEALRFVAWTTDVLEKLPKGIAAWNQLDRGSTSIPLNIAEGNGKHTASDRCRYFGFVKNQLEHFLWFSGSAWEPFCAIGSAFWRSQAEPGNEGIIQVNCGQAL